MINGGLMNGSFDFNCNTDGRKGVPTMILKWGTRISYLACFQVVADDKNWSLQYVY